jgi:heme exporter protein C
MEKLIKLYQAVVTVWNKINRPLLFIGMPLAIWHSYLVGDAQIFIRPEYARIFFWHFPGTIILTINLSAGLYFSWKYLQTRDQSWDIRSQAVHEFAMMFIILTMISGVFFSRVQWNAWWQNDPRQVSFLLVSTIYIAFFVVRSAFQDPDKRAKQSAGFALAAFLPFIFFTFVFSRLPQVDSFHPKDTIPKLQLKGDYGLVTIELLILVGILTHWVYNLRVRAMLLEHKSENLNGNLESPRRSDVNAPVVRRLSDAPSDGESN